MRSSSTEEVCREPGFLRSPIVGEIHVESDFRISPIVGGFRKESGFLRSSAREEALGGVRLLQAPGCNDAETVQLLQESDRSSAIE